MIEPANVQILQAIFKDHSITNCIEQDFFQHYPVMKATAKCLLAAKKEKKKKKMEAQGHVGGTKDATSFHASIIPTMLALENRHITRFFPMC